MVAAFLVWAGDRIHKATNGVAPAFLLLTVAVAGEFVWMIKSCPPFEDRNKDEQAVIADTLKLTHPGETVLDAKGQAIFRRRPYYYVLETITRVRADKGEIVDDVPERLIAERTPVLVRCHWLTEATDRFVKQNYVSVGSVMVLGKKLTPSPDRRLRFEVTVPGKYVMVDDDGDASGKLDGVDWREPRELAPGTHTQILDEVPKSLAIVWARAVEMAGTMEVGPLLKALTPESNLINVVYRAPEGYIQIGENRHAERRVRIANVNAQGKSEVIYETRAAEDPHPYPSGLFLVKAGMLKVQTDEQWKKYANSFGSKTLGGKVSAR